MRNIHGPQDIEGCGVGGAAVIGMSNIIWNVTGNRYGALNV